jgi:hypothetical protein
LTAPTSLLKYFIRFPAKHKPFCSRGHYYPKQLLLAPVKRLTGCILSLYLLLSAVLPCTIIDDCEVVTHTEQTAGKSTEDDCRNCSPLSTCSQAPGFTADYISIGLHPLMLPFTPVYTDHCAFFKSEYYPRFLQPPRMASSFSSHRNLFNIHS